MCEGVDTPVGERDKNRKRGKKTEAVPIKESDTLDCVRCFGAMCVSSRVFSLETDLLYVKDKMKRKLETILR